jgi:Tfp pilus assembly protein PilF
MISLMVGCGPALLAAESPWTEVKSPHFRVLTDGSARAGRRVAREFEQMRAVFSAGFPNMRLETGAPLLIFAVADEASMKSLIPKLWKRGGPNAAGYFQDGWEKKYAVVRLDQDIPGQYQVVYHEYVHTLLHANFAWLPAWLDEGLAEYYGNTYFEQSKMYIGAPSMRVYSMRGSARFPIEELITESSWIRYRTNDRLIDLLYSEAWALVHFFVFGPGMERGAKLSRFYALLEKGEPQHKAIEEVFGPVAKLDEEFSRYTNHFEFSSYEMPNPESIREKEFPSHRMPVAEMETELATYQLWSRDPEDARSSIERALRGDPGTNSPREAIGFLEFGQGKDSEAALEFDKAFGADHQRYLSLFYGTMLASRPGPGASAEQVKFRAAMYDVLKINPQFAPAVVELAIACLREGDLANALVRARRAEQLEPTRAGYHLLTGRILLDLGRPEEAAKKAAFVAENWRQSDHNEALELWNRIPAEKRGSSDSFAEEIPDGVQTVQGILNSVSCAEKGRGTSLTIESNGATLTFRGTGEPSVGYSDTLWYGRDHFDVCHHAEGLRAIVRYKAGADTTFAGEWVELELRDDLQGLSVLKVPSTSERKN